MDNDGLLDTVGSSVGELGTSTGAGVGGEVVVVGEV